ncbi:carbon-nitrogen hydrolase family protein [Nocardioides sp. CFH 31398]|uniref:carbon-nitrogen hydrolase family protein n=1 Tax=Nocardioides sp. CFH 31398 TaxID=2919579 RepID=UPI001F06919A|nr:carbon-nitrogen hydrolase family protein [Nocardioides sp. CFH 31398]MCH1866279.1 carbon-nitrogen hydrolase family protein [Nocardioides sp. CFH 31398]
MTLRLAAAQAEAVAAHDTDGLAANATTAARLVDRAADEGARVVVLPEAFLTGYDAAVLAGPLPGPGDLDSAWLDPLREAVERTGVVALVGVALDRGGSRTLSLLLAAPGRQEVVYDKQHLDGPERPAFTPGAHGVLLDVDDHLLGLSVCYDGCFPEHARAAADAGAVGYLASAAYFTGGEHRADLYYRARALDNGMYVAFAGLTGRCGSGDFIGASAVHDPEGRTLARLGREEGVAVADLDPDLVAATRARHTMTADHRASLGDMVRLTVRGTCPRGLSAS